MVPIHKFRPDLYLAREGSKMRSMALLLAVAGMGYGAGALVHGSPSTANEPLALARPVQASETNFGTALSAAPPLPAARDAIESRRFDAGGIEDPRECDLPNGISTACLFMD